MTSVQSVRFDKMSKREEYDWLDDPFNDKKSSRDSGGMGKGPKVALGLGCLVVVIALIVLLFVGMNAISILSDI